MIIAVLLLILMKITIFPESVRLETCGHGARDHILHSFRTGIAKKFVRLESGETRVAMFVVYLGMCQNPGT